jgi:hypothetical protein
MPLFIAVRCVCGAFQVIQDPKSRKFTCRLCGLKNQSIRKVYAKSEAAKDVRAVVMRLSMTRAAADSEEQEPPLNDYDSVGYYDGDSVVEDGLCDAEPRETVAGTSVGSRWSAFLQEPAPIHTVDDDYDDTVRFWSMQWSFVHNTTDLWLCYSIGGPKLFPTILRR